MHVGVQAANTGTEPVVSKPVKPKPQKQPLPPTEEPTGEENEEAEAPDEQEETPGAKPLHPKVPVAQWDAATAAKVIAGVLQRSGVSCRPVDA